MFRKASPALHSLFDNHLIKGVMFAYLIYCFSCNFAMVVKLASFVRNGDLLNTTYTFGGLISSSLWEIV